MKIKIEIDQESLKQLVNEELQRRLGNIPFDSTKVKIETKSRQNFRSEWESGAGFKAIYEAEI